MYKNFNLTDEERRQIMEQHKSHGYKKPLSEQMNQMGMSKNNDVPQDEPSQEEPSQEPVRKFKPMYDRIEFNNGGKVSIQASSTHYSEPRNDEGPYNRVEIGYPTRNTRIPKSMLRFIEQGLNHREDGELDPYDNVYPYVPASIVRKLIQMNGGVKSGEVPPLAGKTEVGEVEMDENWTSIQDLGSRANKIKGPDLSKLKGIDEPKFEDGDVVHNLERAGQYPWRVVDVYRNFQEVLELNGEGEDTRKLYDSCRGDEEVLNSPFYLLKNASKNTPKRFVGPDFEYQSEYQMSHWDDQGEGVEIDEESDLAEGNWNSPEERERIRMYNETSKGVTMVLQSIDKLFDSINREAYHKCYRAIRNVLKELHDEVNKPQESSVENDDYDERQERNYGVED